MIRERSLHAEPKVNAKTLRQKDRIRTILRRVRRKGAHQRGNLRKGFFYEGTEGNLSGNDGGIVDWGLLCHFNLHFYYLFNYFICKEKGKSNGRS